MSNLAEKNPKVINVIFLRCSVSIFGVYNREKNKNQTLYNRDWS